MKIMFICTGNICRSAMAHAIMQKKIAESGKKSEIYSCGIYAEDGDVPTREAINVMKKYNVDLTSHRATNIKKSNIENMDIILVATLAHKQMVINMYPKLKEKVYTMKEFAGYKENLDIKDPWGFDEKTYERCAEEIISCIEKYLEKENII